MMLIHSNKSIASLTATNKDPALHARSAFNSTRDHSCRTQGMNAVDERLADYKPFGSTETFTFISLSPKLQLTVKRITLQLQSTRF